MGPKPRRRGKRSCVYTRMHLNRAMQEVSVWPCSAARNHSTYKTSYISHMRNIPIYQAGPIMTFSRFRLLALFVCLLAFSVGLYSQAGVASLSGLLTDPSGAIVVGAQVTATNQATQVSRTTVTDHSGYYTFVGMPVGVYDISVNQSGFAGERAIVNL